MHFDLRDRDVGVPLEVLRELVDRAARLGIAIVVIGAAARDLVVHAPTRQHPNRVTLDVDVAIAVDRDGFAAFTAVWPAVSRSEHKFLIRGVEVDVVPFGSIERGRQVTLNDGHLLDVNGIAEADATAVTARVSQDLTVRSASLPAQAALKVLAWRDRRHVDRKDARDLREILSAAAMDPYVDAVWDDTAVLERCEYDVSVSAAFIVGRLSGRAFEPKHGQAVLEVVGDPALAAQLSGQMGGPISGDLLAAFTVGFQEGLQQPPSTP